MSKKEFLIGLILGLILLLITSFSAYQNSAKGLLKIVFCDVGQGDAAFIRTPSGQDVLIDAGPDERVLNCLNHNLPFWDRDIEMVIISHPQADHIGGLPAVLKHYKIGTLMMENQADKSAEYKEVRELITERKITVQNPFSGQRIDFGDGTEAKIIWPERKWLAGRINGRGEILGASTFRGDLNATSTVLLFNYGVFKILFTGDADMEIQPEILRNISLENADILKIPHHGSKKAVTEKFLETVRPKLAVISVGKNNRFGHPAKELMKKLTELKIPILRTDQKGEIKFISDGRNWREE